jgi:threonine aldolase
MDLIDLRSDTVTRPSPAMRKAMAEAEVGDDVFGDDPTVLRLQERSAELLGKEAGLFVPSGTMANQVSLGSLCGPGDELICEPGSHCVSFEGGALAMLWGIQARTVPGEDGIIQPADVEAAIRPNADRFAGVPGPVAETARRIADHFPRTRCVAIENTHNRGGGAVYPIERVRELAALASRHKLSLYLDGARLFNAVAASGVSAKEYAAGAALVSICLSKGLGAPAGSVVCGSRELIEKARRLRKCLGGAMRQAGVLAAAGLYALEHNRERLSEDHANARRLAEGLSKLKGVKLKIPVHTNMVYAAFPGRSAEDICVRLMQSGLLSTPSSNDTIRFVTHLDVPARAVDEAIERIGRILKTGEAAKV